MMEKTMLSNQKYIGIDLHADQFTCCALGDGTKLWQRTFSLNKDGLDEFLKLVDKNSYVSIEATTNAFSFKKLIDSYVREVFIYDAYKLKLISLVNRKTDTIDANKLAVYLKMQVVSGEKMVRPVYVPSRTIQELRSLFTTYKLVTKQSTSIKNRIHALLRQHLYQYKKGRIFIKKIRQEILELDLPAELRFQIELLYRQIDYLKDQEDALEKRIKLLGAEFIDDVRILTSMKGISVFTALALIADYADISRFKNSKNFTSYLRSTPSVDSSNDKTYIGKTSKFGRKLSLSLLTQSIEHFKTGNQKIARWHSLKQGHKSSGKIRMAICRKVLGEIYCMLTRRTLHYYCDTANHDRKMNTYRAFLRNQGISLIAA